MLSYILAVTVILGSFAFYMAAFFFPEVHRKGDFIWSGVGLFYALVLWFCAGRITGAVLLGQIASVALVGWFGWQTLQLRRETTPFLEQTKVSEPEKLQSEASKMGGRLTSLFKRQPKPTLVIDRKKEQLKVEAAPPIPTAVTPAEIVAPPIAIEALTPDREVVEASEALVIEEAIAPPEVKPPKAIEPKKSPSSAPSKQGWFASLFKRQPKPTLVIDRKGKPSPGETAQPTPTAVTPAEIVAPPIATEALTPDREVVEASEALVIEEAIAPEELAQETALSEDAIAISPPEFSLQETLVQETALSEDAIAFAPSEVSLQETLVQETAPSEDAIAFAPPEVSLQEVELATWETTTEVENLPSAAALEGATAEDEAISKNEDFEVEEGFEAEPEATKIEAKATAAKKEPAKGKASTKPASGGGLADKILAPVTGLFSAVQNGIGGLFSKSKKPKTQPVTKTQPVVEAAPDIEEAFEEEDFPLEMNAIVEEFKIKEATQTAGESESLSDEELIAEEESTMDAKEIMEEPIDPEAIASAIATPEASENKVEEAAIASAIATPEASENKVEEAAIAEAIATPEASENKVEEAAIAEAIATPEASENKVEEAAIAEAITTPEASENKVEEAAIAEAISTPEASENKVEEAAIAPFEMTAQIVEEVKITVEQSADKPSEVEVTVSIADVVIAVQSVSITETNPVAEPETSAEIYTEESVPEAISPNPPSPEIVEAARSAESDAIDSTITSEPIEEIAPEVDLAPPAEASEEASVEVALDIEPEPAKAIEIAPLEEATPVEEMPESEEEGFAKLVRSNRGDAAIVETDKKSAEAKITPEIGDSAKASEE